MESADRELETLELTALGLIEVDRKVPLEAKV